jgi:hypothetical protein
MTDLNKSIIEKGFVQWLKDTYERQAYHGVAYNDNDAGIVDRGVHYEEWDEVPWEIRNEIDDRIEDLPLVDLALIYGNELRKECDYWKEHSVHKELFGRKEEDKGELFNNIIRWAYVEVAMEYLDELEEGIKLQRRFQ